MDRETLGKQILKTKLSFIMMKLFFSNSRYLKSFFLIFGFILAPYSIRAFSQTSNSLETKLEAPKKGHYVIDFIAAVVNNDIVLDSVVKRRALANFQALPDTPSLQSDAGKRKLSELYRRALDELIEEQLILQQASNPLVQATLQQLGPPEELIRKTREVLKAQNGFTSDEQLNEAIKAQGYSEQEFNNRLITQLKIQQIVNISVVSKIQITTDDLLAYYKQKTKQVESNNLKVNVLHILLSVSAQADNAEVEKKQAIANSMMQQLKQGEPFENVAKEHEPEGVLSAPVDLGFLDIGDLPDVLRQEVSKLEKDQIAGPIRSERGFHFIKLIGTQQDGILPFDKVNQEDLRKQLLEQKTQTALQNWTRMLRKGAYIDVRSEPTISP